nr:N-acyl-aromatic-L-amino acid amidohydrolase (carboxylate-forming) [Equus caballus]
MLGSVAGVKADAAAEQLSRKKSHNGTQELSNSVAKNGTALELGPQPQGVPPAEDESPSGCSSGRTPFPAFQMETYRLLSSVDFPRPGAGDLAGTVHPQLQVWQGEGTPGSQPWRCQGKLRPKGRDHRCLPQDHQHLRNRSRRTGAQAPSCLPGNLTLRPGTRGHSDRHSTHGRHKGTPQQEDHLYERESTVSPRSISEAAHSEKGIAFVQTEQLTFSMPTLPTLAPAATHHP